jgi:type IV pilus assembly protein PilA
MLALLRNKKGVTLVELLAVIIILGIIAAIAVPTIGKLIDNQRQNAAETEWANILEAARLYKTAEPTKTTVTLAVLVADGYIDVAVGDVVLDDDANYAEATETTLAEISALASISFSISGTPAITFPATYTHVFVNGKTVVPAV